MSAIVIFGGTSEGRLLGSAFKNTDIELHICTVTEYGSSLIEEGENIHIHNGAMDREEMKGFIKKIAPLLCIDATHPYAAEATKNIYSVCSELNINYIRTLRDEGSYGSEVIYAESVEKAVEFLNSTKGNIFITTGSKELEKYIKIENYRDRCIARVLPTVGVMEKCSELGFEGKNIICMQGPFSEEMNYCMLRQSKAVWLVTKNSGSAGGFEEKCRAAKRAGAGIVVIGRKEENNSNVMSLSKTIEYVENKYNIKRNRQVYLIGIGMGGSKLMTGEACEDLEKADVIIGAGRILEACREYGNKPFYKSYDKKEIAEFLNEHKEYNKAAIVYSGDIGFYSGAKGMKDILNEYEVHYISGISSPQYLLNSIGIPWEDVRLVSCHGQEINIISKIKYNRRVCALTGGRKDVGEICKKLVSFGMNDVKITVGERLSYSDEKITRGTASELAGKEFNSLSVVFFENDDHENCKTGSIKDEAFIRGDVPMTKEEIRTVVIGKLHLDKNSVLYDIGSGTGSVSVEAARICRKVYAVERKEEAARLTEKNVLKFKADNIEIIRGTAPECIENLPVPTHVFIGGSGGKLKEIVNAVRCKNVNARFVVTAVSVETIAEMEKLKAEYGDMEIVQLNVSRARKTGEYNLMRAENPVFIFAFGGCN